MKSSLRKSTEQKIPDIKALRMLTIFLGKLHIPSCFRVLQVTDYEYDNITGVLIRSCVVDKEAYGWGLKECKDYVESKYEYVYMPTVLSPLKEIQRGNMIQEIRATRYAMRMLKLFDLKNATIDLRLCRSYVERQRARR